MLLAVLSALVATAITCNIKVMLSAQTDKPVWAQFTFHNETKSKIYFFKKAGNSDELHVEDAVCNLKPSILTTYNKHPDRKTVPIGSTSAFLEGIGVVDYLIHDTIAPRMGMRLGVTCGFGDCGARG